MTTFLKGVEQFKCTSISLKKRSLSNLELDRLKEVLDTCEYVINLCLDTVVMPTKFENVLQCLNYTNLTEIYLINNGISNIDFLCQHLHDSTYKLNLSDNPIGLLGGKSLAKKLVNNTSLIDICLSNCSLGDTGVTYICDAIKTHNRTLIRLYLSENQIGSNHNNYDLNYNNNIISNGVYSICSMIKNNNVLQTLSLWNNVISDYEMAQIHNSILYNSSLEILNIDMLDRSDIFDVCDRNTENNIKRDTSLIDILLGAKNI